MSKMTRRAFLGNTVKTSAGLYGLAAIPTVTSRVLGANERINMALIGCGGRGSYVTRGMAELGAEITQLCDLHPGKLEDTAKFIGGVQERKPLLVKDMRKVFESKDVDAVVVATPDHWHAPASIMACQAGKDVYVEKPHSHNIWEGRKMIEAAHKYNRIVQVGTQNRSAAYNIAAREYVKSGKLGDIRIVKVYNLKPGKPFHLGESKPMPAGFDWDAWLGGAPERSWHSRVFQSGWHKFWDFSGGDMADDGVHQLDLAMMVLGDPGIASAVACSGGRLQHKGDDAEIPDVQIVTYEFDGFVMTFEGSRYPRYMRKTTGTIRQKDKFPYWTQNSTRIELYGSELMMTIGRHGGGWQVTTVQGRVEEQMYGRFPDAEHRQNFIDCVKSRKRPNSDVETLHKSCSLVHMGNIAHRIGNQKLWFDSKTEQFINNAEASKLVKREYRKKYEPSEQV